MKWKRFSLMLCLSLAVLLLAGCGGPKDADAPQQTTAPVQTEAPGFSLADTFWKWEGVPYAFSSDGTVKVTVEPGKFKLGSYQWDGHTGSVTIDDVTQELRMDGETLLMKGADGFYYGMEPASADAQPEPPETPLPAPEDPLECSVVMSGTDPQMVIPYPATMKVCGEDMRIVQLDAVSEEEADHNILLSWVEIGSGFDWQFRTGLTQAERGLAEICQLWMDNVYGDRYLEHLDGWAVDGGSYYSYKCFCWLSGEIYSEGSDTPVRGVVEFRYYGPTGYVLVVCTTAEADRIDNYAAIGANILNSIDYGGDWSTEPIKYSGGGSSDGRGDTFGDEGRGDYFEDEGRGDTF